MNGQKTSIPARLTVFGFSPTGGRMEVEYRPFAVRLTRTLISLALCWGIAPVVFLIPPHFEWALAAVLAGIYYARKNWTAEYVVKFFEGTCPSCGSTLDLEPGTTIRFPHGLTCFECHHEPFLRAEPEALRSA